MTLSEQIKAYLDQSGILYSVGDFATGRPDGQPDQILRWDTEKLGAQPTSDQLAMAEAAYVPPPSEVPTKEQLLVQLQTLQAQIQALE